MVLTPKDTKWIHAVVAVKPTRLKMRPKKKELLLSDEI